MSVSSRALKLAQHLDEKGLHKEADTLDELAESIILQSSTEDGFDRIDPETYMEMFREIFLLNSTEEGMEPAAAASAAVRTVNKL